MKLPALILLLCAPPPHSPARQAIQFTQGAGEGLWLDASTDLVHWRLLARLDSTNVAREWIVVPEAGTFIRWTGFNGNHNPADEVQRTNSAMLYLKP